MENRIAVDYEEILSSTLTSMLNDIENFKSNVDQIKKETFSTLGVSWVGKDADELSKTINTNKVDEKGETTYNTIYFTKNTVKSDEYAEIEFSIFVKGNMNKNYKDSVNYKNSIEEITYTGNVPSEYRNSKNGSIIGKQNIMEKMKEELNNRVKSKVKQIHDSSLEI